MGSDGLNPAYASHRVTTPNPNNCVCHAGDVSQTGDFEIANIRPATGFGSTDFDGDGNKTESLKSEIAGLEDILYAQIRTYSATTLGKFIVYDGAAYPYWFVDTNNNNIHDTGEGSYTTFDAALLKAAYNYQFSKKEPCGYIHNSLYLAQVLADSTIDIGGTVPNVGVWR
jgi:hypothetical protein